MAPPANNYVAPSKSDVESATLQSEELRRKKKMKYLTYGVAFVVFQTIVIVVFSLTVMKVKSPKFRVRSGTLENLTVGTANSPTFSMRFIGQLGVKNTNFGPFKYDNTTITFAYRGTPVGELTIRKSKANLLSTKKIDVSTQLSFSSSSNEEWSNDINSGVLPLTSSSKLKGKVTLMFIMKKKKSTNMNCTMELVVATQAIRNLRCS